VWDLKQSLREVGSDLGVRVGTLVDVVRDAIQHLQKESGIESKLIADPVEGAEPKSCRGVEVVSVWMTADEGFEEKTEQEELQICLESQGKQFRPF
jgi:hypothetical protein